METQTEIVELDLARLAEVIWRGKWKILLGMVSTGVGALVLSLLLLKPVYKAGVLFYVDGAPAQTAMVLLETEDTLSSIAAGTPWSREQVAKNLTARVRSENVYFEVIVRWDSPELAKEVADAVARVLPKRVETVLPNVRLIVADVPVLPEKPAGPRWGQILLAGMIAGGAVSVAWLGGRAFFATEKRQRYGDWERR